MSTGAVQLYNWSTSSVTAVKKLLSFDNISMLVIFECTKSPICLGGRRAHHT